MPVKTTIKEGRKILGREEHITRGDIGDVLAVAAKREVLSIDDKINEALETAQEWLESKRLPISERVYFEAETNQNGLVQSGGSYLHLYLKDFRGCKFDSLEVLAAELIVKIERWKRTKEPEDLFKIGYQIREFEIVLVDALKKQKSASTPKERPWDELADYLRRKTDQFTTAWAMVPESMEEPISVWEWEFYRDGERVCVNKETITPISRESFRSNYWARRKKS